MKILLNALAIAFLSVGIARAQDPAFTNDVDMQFVLIHPGTMQVGVFQPTCPPRNQQLGQGFAPGAGPGGPNPSAATSGAPQANGTPAQSGVQHEGSGSVAAAGSRGPGGRGGPGARPQDPRNQWTDADYARCEELITQETSAGFPVTIA